MWWSRDLGQNMGRDGLAANTERNHGGYGIVTGQPSHQILSLKRALSRNEGYQSSCNGARSVFLLHIPDEAGEQDRCDGRAEPEHSGGGEIVGDLAVSRRHLSGFDEISADEVLHGGAGVAEHADQADGGAAGFLRADVHGGQSGHEHQQSAQTETETARAQQLPDAVFPEQEEVSAGFVYPRRKDEYDKTHHHGHAIDQRTHVPARLEQEVGDKAGSQCAGGFRDLG